ncbi:MAG TPA: four helix bundle protein [Chitinophagaceae bacterium]|nr:four helix bundle protein [Chitinophagaceae bacterium]
MKESILKTKSFAFAVRIVKMQQYLEKDKKEFILSKQIVRSGTAIGALVYEAQYAQSTADFIYKLSISQKEAHETEFWIDLLEATDYISASTKESIKTDLVELQKMLVASIKTSKAKKQ